MMNPKLWGIEQIVTSGLYPFTRGQLRHLLTCRHKNNLNKSVVKIGKRIYFKMPEFDQWILDQSCNSYQPKKP